MSDSRVVGVTAPAGYGKSTLLAEWADTETRPVAWVSLDRFDNDPAALVTVLAAAFARATGANADLVADVSGLGMSSLGRAAPRLASTFRSTPVPFVLMLDDLHELRSPACHDVLSVVISGVPSGSQLVAASRAEQPHLPRFRASGDGLELVVSDLALDSSGAEQIFSTAQVAMTPELAATVTERTEGWPAGLYLAAMIARDSNADALTISGDDRYVADYLYRESLMKVSASDQEFLRRTAVLDQMCAPLCDAVLGDTGSQDQLRGLEASSQFLVPLDRRREWYRYHALFREFLLAELRRVEPELIPKLHLRAADWYEANGSPTSAVEHLLHTDEQDRCVHLVTANAMPTYRTANISTVQRWLAALGDDAIIRYPPLAVLAGWMAVFSGQPVEAERWAAVVETASFDQVPADGSASFESARSMFRALLCAAGPEQMLADATFAVAQEPAWSPWRDEAEGLLAEALVLTGDVEHGAALFAEISAQSANRPDRDTRLVSEAELAVLAIDRGAWSEAAERVDVAVAAVERFRMHDYAIGVLAFAVAARVAVHRGDLPGANRLIALAMRGRPALTYALPTFAVRARLQLSRACSAIGDRSAARHLLREIDDVLRHRPALGVLVEEVDALREQLAASTQVGAIGGPPLTPAELRLLPYLQTHLTFREIGERLFVSRNTISTQCGSIYRKLGVSSRNDAVEHATAVGLLGG